MSAETGVGPAIASGSQVIERNLRTLPDGSCEKNRVIRVIWLYPYAGLQLSL